MKFILNFFTNTLAESKYKRILGQIFITVGDFKFPSSNWNDFVVIIMAWWLNELSLLISGKISSCKCSFMEGPYSFEISLLTKNTWEIKCMNNESCILKEQVEVLEVIDAFMTSSFNIIKLCQDNEWKSKDVSLLESTYKDFVKTVNKRKNVYSA